ncbi:MAG: hypothetical protein JOZ77_08675 [Candidatus Eremiobacteraeota bacterium]|nr:hypothetical protein [Candidatus Eremiobacteraeota bacterium]
MELRPLAFGEIFDRAVTLYIRNFVPFAAIVGVMVVPLGILQYFADLNAQPQLDAAFRIFTHPQTARTEPMPTMFDSPTSIAVLVLLALVAYIIWPFALNAVAVGVSLLYRNMRVDFRTCYNAVFRRWPQIVGMIFIALFVFLGWYVALFAVLMVVGGLVAMLAVIASGFAIFLGITIGIVSILAFLLGFASLMIAVTFAMYAVVIEERPAIDSLALGFSRVFNRREFWRAVLFSLAAGAVVFAGSAMLGFVSIMAALAHLPLLQAVIDTVSRAVITPFAAVLLAIYYFDVRIRHEALDLETSLERLVATQSAR